MPFEKAAAFTLRKMNIVCDLRQGNRFGIGGWIEERMSFRRPMESEKAGSLKEQLVKWPYSSLQISESKI